MLTQFLLTLFVLLAPWSNIPVLLILHIATCSTLLIHWLKRSQKCSLATIEASLRGCHADETLTHKLVSPIYDIDNPVIYSITFILMCISMYKLYTNRYKFAQAYNLCTQIGNKYGIVNKLRAMMSCYGPIFFDSTIQTAMKSWDF